ncbi:HEPN domain-containing protein [Streptomyces sp. XY431]|uniref:HEPN domain-containing protein n=1 Tax=Streptomyces sp. XY431 TaxID=1415562 RepID=UPI000B102B81|nr:HEPN domain-containing protein [Streptomyces sp. XY431]
MDLLDELKNDIAELKSSLLPDDVLRVKAPDDLTRRQELLISSFVILSHAHIEEFVENLFREYVENREKEITDATVPHCFVKLALHFSSDLIGQGAGNRFPTRQICTTAKNLYISKVINTNHGLKESNVGALAKPLGVHGERLSNSCEQLFVTLNTLGGKRGRMAHTSSRNQAASETVYASQAIVWVEDVINLAHQLNNYLCSGN